MQALQLLRQSLPPHAVLVGQGINQDIQWLDLKEGIDFQVVEKCNCHDAW